MKKIFSLLVVLSMLLGTTAFADNGMEAALKTVKSRLPSTEKFDRFNSRVSTAESGKTVYRFNWENQTEDLSVIITQSGIITAYYSYSEGTDASSKLSIDRKTHEQVISSAESFLKTINPDISDELRISTASQFESLRETDYEYRIQRYCNDLPVYGDSGYLSVAPDGETVTSFYMNYTEGLKFEKNENLISEDAAKAAFGDKIGVRLYYTAKTESGNKTAVAVYAPNETGAYISAVSGEIVTPVTPSGEAFAYDSGSAADLESAKNDVMFENENGFSDAEKAELEKTAELISKEDAAEIVLKNKVLKLDNGYSAVSFDLCRDYYDQNRYFWQITFNSNGVYADAKVDASTGRITSFYKERDYRAEKEISEQQAKNTAFAAISMLAPEFFPEDGESCYHPIESKGKYHYVWQRFQNGIPYSDETAYVDIDGVDGSVCAYSLVYQNLEFSPLEGIMDTNAAVEKLFEYTTYTPQYIKTCSSEGATAYDSAYIVYVPENENIVFLADSGELLYNFRQNTEIEPYSDLEGHFAQSAANTLRKYGIGYAGGKFLPDEIITQKDLTAFLNCIFLNTNNIIISKDTGYTSVYNQAVRKGIILESEKAPDSEVSRGEAAIMLIRAMGLEDAAVLNGIYNCPFADVTENKGYVSILAAMGVFKGDQNGNFNPTAPLSRGEAAIILLNYLSK